MTDGRSSDVSGVIMSSSESPITDYSGSIWCIRFQEGVLHLCQGIGNMYPFNIPTFMSYNALAIIPENDVVLCAQKFAVVLLADKNILPYPFVLCYNMHGFNTVSHRVRDLQVGCSVAFFLFD